MLIMSVPFCSRPLIAVARGHNRSGFQSILINYRVFQTFSVEIDGLGLQARIRRGLE
jgi:hypothetical protein